MMMTYVGVKYVTCVSVLFPCDLCALIGLLVIVSIVVVLVLLLFSFPVDGVVGVPVHLFFVVCYCFLFWNGCVLSS